MLKTYFKPLLGGVKMNLGAQRKVSSPLVIFESDDWGAIRTPSKEVLSKFERKGFEISKSLYKVDALASSSDLNNLLDLLARYKGADGNSPIFTANAIMANPDFDKIEQSDFQNYYWEPFTTTFTKYPEHQNNLDIWKKGMEEKLFHPQFHGREHLNIKRWLMALQRRDEAIHYSFKYGSTYSGKEDYAFMEAFDWNKPEEVFIHKKIIKEGLDIFEQTFGYNSKSFIAPCYNWDPRIESSLADFGIEWIQGIGSQLAPTGVFNHYQSIPHSFGKTNVFGTKYNIRNVYFEPVNNPNLDWTSQAMARIQAAFWSHVPAVISTHRLNYVGFIDPKNRDNGLKQLDLLLKKITKKWPHAIFISTSDLEDYLI